MVTTNRTLLEMTVADLRRQVGSSHSPMGQDLLREARDGLIDASEAYQTAGLERPEAERRAVDDFGDLSLVAAAIREEIGALAVRRTGLVLGLGYVAILSAWALLYAVDPPQRIAPPTIPWASSSFDVLGVLALLLAVCFLISLRWSARRQRSVRPSQWLAAGVVTACSLLTIIAAQLVEPFTPGGGPGDGGGIGKHLVEGFSGLVVLVMLTQAALCARQAWRSRVAYSTDARGDER